jgi:hypothetical protein
VNDFPIAVPALGALTFTCTLAKSLLTTLGDSNVDESWVELGRDGGRNLKSCLPWAHVLTLDRVEGTDRNLRSSGGSRGKAD